MKILLRTTFLAAALLVTILTATGTAAPDGSCITTCYSSSGITYVEWHTQTQAECCSELIPPCPPGSQAGWSSYKPYLKPRMACPPPV